MNEAHSRKQMRLSTWDYRQAATYIVTICAQHREHRFGRVVEEEMYVNAAGAMVDGIWREIPTQFPSVFLDQHVIMPNHIHGILGMNHDDWEHPQVSLASVIQWFKTVTTNRYIAGVRTQGWPAYDGRLWQRSYFEMIIRNEAMLETKRNYIMANPSNWLRDDEYTP